jgi:hypothetical protein
MANMVARRAHGVIAQLTCSAFKALPRSYIDKHMGQNPTQAHNVTGQAGVQIRHRSSGARHWSQRTPSFPTIKCPARGHRV